MIQIIHWKMTKDPVHHGPEIREERQEDINNKMLHITDHYCLIKKTVLFTYSQPQCFLCVLLFVSTVVYFTS